MNDQQRYEQEIAEKLRQLPLPDMDTSWKQMKALLDEEMPRRGGWWRRNRRWGLGFLVLLLFVSVWFITDQNNSPQVITKKMVSGSRNTTTKPEEEKEEPPAIPEVENARSDTMAAAKEIDDRNSTNKASPTTEPRIVSIAPTAATKNNRETDGKILHSKKESSGSDNTTNNNDNKADRTARLKYKKDKRSSDDLSVATPDRNLNANKLNTPDGSSVNPNRYSSGANKNSKENSVVLKTRKGSATSELNSVSKTSTQSTLAKDLIDADLNPQTDDKLVRSGSIPNLSALPSASLKDLDYSIVKLNAESPLSFSTSSIAPDSIQKNYVGAVRQGKITKMRNGKPVKIKPPYSSVGRSFAIGFSLPLGFPLGDQKPLAYNFNAGNNTVSDFLPSPHLQYHFNEKSYLQSEVQVMSPQFIRPILLAYNKYQNTATNVTVQNSTYARKLYYFNLPVSVHYSPFKHFYLGTGLQFSSLISGVAFLEEQRTGNVPAGELYRSSYTRFRNDTLSGKLNGNEFRLMMDANYYWNKFTVGLRYNQALSNYVDLRATQFTPAVADKNKLLQFYLRYNLWENKRTIKPSLAIK